MKTKINYLFIFLGCMLIFPHIAKADCSYEREAELSRIAANVQFSYTYEQGVGVGAYFKIQINNLTNDIYILDDNMNYISGIGEIEKAYSGGEKIAFTIYSNDESCKNKDILTQYVNLPTYNVYSQNEKCKTNPNFKYCQIWGNFNITPEQFEIEIKKYQKKTDQKNNIKEESLLDLLKKNLLITTIIFSIFIFLIALFTFRKKFRRK